MLPRCYCKFRNYQFAKTFGSIRNRDKDRGGIIISKSTCIRNSYCNSNNNNDDNNNNDNNDNNNNNSNNNNNNNNERNQ